MIVSAIAAGALVTGVPAAVGFAAHRPRKPILAANVVFLMVLAVAVARSWGVEVVASYLLGGAFGQLFVIGVVTFDWQVDAMIELGDRADEPEVFGHSHAYWDWRLWWSVYHVVKFRRLCAQEQMSGARTRETESE